MLNNPIFLASIDYYCVEAEHRDYQFLPLLKQKDAELLKSMFVTVYMDSVYPLLFLSSLRPSKTTDAALVQVVLIMHRKLFVWCCSFVSNH